MKNKRAIFILLIIIAVLIVAICIITVKTNIFPGTADTENTKNLKSDSDNLIENTSKNKKQKKLADTSVVLFFNDLSNKYNYRITDRYHCNGGARYYDSIARVISVFDKNGSLIQTIHPALRISPWYFNDQYALKISRSFITGKNANYKDIDNYCGEIVVADLNFDGLEDFATPVDQGADNGPHYAFYIQDKNNRFILNSYLTEKVIWFPEKFNDSLMTMTSVIPCTIYGLKHITHQYDTISKNWKKTGDYTIDVRTGKLLK